MKHNLEFIGSIDALDRPFDPSRDGPPQGVRRLGLGEP
jgi:hypothetical protein